VTVAPEQTDRRRLRGGRTRQALLEATLRVIERDGVAGVTHRRVTQEAGLPATSAAYHFPSINDLLEAALLSADEQSGEALREIARSPSPIRALSRWLVDDVRLNRSRCMAEYELFLYAARTPSLRTAAGRWLDDLDALVAGWTPSRRARRAVCAYVDGLLIQTLVTGAFPRPTDVAATIRGMLEIR
jgi:TetR/AcrR family transcriptional regulator, regulator of biofilm formation and stress response